LNCDRPGGDDRTTGALLACRGEGQAALGGGALRPPRARRRHTPARSEADRHGDRSTQELAPLIGISEAGLSKHLGLLARAGLVERRRQGYYVLYTLSSDRIANLSQAVLAFLGRAA
jgi:DNA-binding transcriptional ArsR family regulator